MVSSISQNLSNIVEVNVNYLENWKTDDNEGCNLVDRINTKIRKFCFEKLI